MNKLLFTARLPQSGLSLAAGQQKALPGSGTLGRYVIIYTGTTQQGTLGLDDVQVYAFGELPCAHAPALWLSRFIRLW